MKRLLTLSSLLPALIVFAAAAFAANPAASRLKQLDISAGEWVYHGHFPATKTSPAVDWTWHENCRWSANNQFMMCSFSNDWGKQHVDSLVVDTYNTHDKSFWHYEIFNSGADTKPFAARMQIDGNTRTETWTQTHKRKIVHERIVYKFISDKKVEVLFQQSQDGAHWNMTAEGSGEKVVAARD